jgi:hypothetical protein
MGKVRDRTLAEFFQDTARVDRWLAMTLGSLVSGATPGDAPAKK